MNTFVIFVLSLVCLSQTAHSICPCMQGLINTDLSYLSQKPVNVGTVSNFGSTAGSFASSAGSFVSSGGFPANIGYSSVSPVRPGVSITGVNNGLGLTAAGGLNVLNGVVNGAGALNLSL